MVLVNVEMDKIKKIECIFFIGILMEVKFLYFILIVGIGVLFGILGCVLSVGMYRKLCDCV